MSSKPRVRRHTRDAVAVGRFVERFAMVMTASGMPRMPARVFLGLLTADEGRRSAAQLAESLKVSRAAVSGAVKYLTAAGIVRREREPGQRVDSYSVDGELWLESFARRDAVLLLWEKSLAEGVVALGEGTPAGERLEETRRFFAFLRGEFPAMMRKWRKLRAREALSVPGRGAGR